MSVSVTKDDIVRGLRDLGLRAGDVLHVHSSLSSFGHVEGGAESVIAALMEVLTQEGTLMLPSYGDFQGGEYGKVQPGAIIFDVRSSPSKMGRIPDVFWRMPGVRRSIHPTHCQAAWGKRRDWLLAGHERCLQSCGCGTPLWKLTQCEGKILLIGVDHRSNTFIHTLEDAGPAPSTTRSRFEPKVVDYDGNAVTVPTHPHLPGLARRFHIADDFCRERGLQTETTVGNARLRLINARGFWDAAQAELREDPLFFIDADYYRARSAEQSAK
jgi:aminoglycoside 3-N-acetyltransferase